MTYSVKILAIVFLAFTVLGCANKNIAMGLAQGLLYSYPKCKTVEEYQKSQRGKVFMMSHLKTCEPTDKMYYCVKLYKKNNQNKTPTDKDCPM